MTASSLRTDIGVLGPVPLGGGHQTTEECMGKVVFVRASRTIRIPSSEEIIITQVGGPADWSSVECRFGSNLLDLLACSDLTEMDDNMEYLTRKLRDQIGGLVGRSFLTAFHATGLQALSHLCLLLAANRDNVCETKDREMWGSTAGLRIRALIRSIKDGSD